MVIAVPISIMVVSGVSEQETDANIRTITLFPLTSISIL